MYTHPDHPWHTPDPVRDLPVPAETRGPVDVILDTDTYNEVDDQFALVYSLLNPERLNMLAIHAAPFHNKRSTGPGDGMEKSYDEIQRVLERMHWDKPLPVHRGSKTYLSAADKPVDSDAARDLVERAMQNRDQPLHVIAIGAITNVASALLMEPRIASRIRIYWLAGQPLDWPRAREFNLVQDMHASRLIFDSGVPLVLVPCTNVAEHIRISIPELRELIAPAGEIGQYLFDTVAGYHDDHRGWSKVIWDVAPIASLLNAKWVPTALDHSPILTDQQTYSRDRSRHMIRVATHANRDPIWRDIADKLLAYAKQPA
ncbi:MAG: nucleoside hydrolase [Phycisphaeraceae bacterium]